MESSLSNVFKIGMKEGLKCAKEERRGKNRKKRKDKKERMKGT